MMGISRMYLPVLGLSAALLAPACGGDSGSNTSNENSSQTGSGGSESSQSSGGPSSCTPTRCKNDALYTLSSQDLCDVLDKGPCGPAMRARVQCSLANETCTADGLQDKSKVDAACKAQLDAYDMCTQMLANSGS